ncbi:hypothetical protein N7493_011436 [Penicillium malachiteum]|uniref:O-methyltransferase domain-containing protein n=1 Tax=Penicillium malachiteum TaxID=1324776 RepID=A0AAD6HC40_9EURO|nr:hypothetical protein N7493_011436 [Penicillium malachiteum]
MLTTSMASLADEIKQEIGNDSFSAGESHARLLQLIEELKLAVETPTETILRLIYQPPENAALRTVVDLDIFSLLVNSEKPGGISATDLSQKTKAERELIIRLMRVMTSLGLCVSPEPEIYQATDKAIAMTQPIGRDGVPCIYDLTLPALSKLPEYLREHNYINPEEYSTSPMQWAVGKSQFEWLAENKSHQTRFNSYMSSRRDGKPSWYNVYPIDRLTAGAVNHADAIFLVDIGGNQGHDLGKLHAQYPSLPGRLILQDLPKILSKVNKPGIECMSYSFLDPQPIKNARTYYFRAIFHDWPDRICRKILLNTISAMNPEYSRIIIVDFVLPDTKVPRMQAAMDIQMMSIGAGVERSKKQWHDLLTSVGLKITGIWNCNPAMESVIEVVPLADSSEE